MTTTSRKLGWVVFQYLLILFVSLLLGGIVLIDIEIKWKFVLIMGLGIVVLILSTNPKQTLLFLTGVTVPILLTKAFVIVANQNAGYELTGIGIKQTDVIAFALLLILLVPAALEKTKINLFPAITLPALAWILMSALSLISAQNLLAAIAMLIFMFQQFFIYLIIANCIINKSDMEWLLGGIVLAVFFEATLGIYQGIVGHPAGLYFLGETNSVYQQTLGQASFNRVQGTLGYSNSFSMYILTGLPFLLAWFFISKNKITRLLCGAIFLIGATSLVFSLSRSSWIGFLIISAMGVIAAVYLKRIKMGYAVLFALLASLVIIGLVIFGPDVILIRLTANDQGSAYSRITLAQTAMRMIMDHPLLGVGLNNYVSAMHYYDPSGFSTNVITMVHNVYLFVTAETGLLGGITFIVLLASALINCWQVFIRSKDDTLLVLSIGLFCAITAIAIHGLVDYDLIGDGRVTTQFWLLIAMVAALVQYQKNNETLPG
jgi:putative inorganic carbon (hco3(-)) transporter